MCQAGADWLRQFELDVDLTTAAESSSRVFFFLSQFLASYLTLRVERFHCFRGNRTTACGSRQTSDMNSSNAAELCFLFARRRASATSCSSLTSCSCCLPARAWAASYSRWAMPSCSSSSCTLRPRVESHSRLTQWHCVAWKVTLVEQFCPIWCMIMMQKFYFLPFSLLRDQDRYYLSYRYYKI